MSLANKDRNTVLALNKWKLSKGEEQIIQIVILLTSSKIEIIKILTMRKMKAVAAHQTDKILMLQVENC